MYDLNMYVCINTLYTHTHTHTHIYIYISHIYIYIYKMKTQTQHCLKVKPTDFWGVQYFITDIIKNCQERMI